MDYFRDYSWVLEKFKLINTYFVAIREGKKVIREWNWHNIDKNNN